MSERDQERRRRRVRTVTWAAALVAAVGVTAVAVATSGRFSGAALFLGFAAAALVWVVWVLGRAASVLLGPPTAEDAAKATGRRRRELEREKQALLKALKELEFDHEMGKISDADYREIGGNYRARAVRVLRQLDVEAGGADYRALVERDVKNRRAAAGGDGELEAALAEKKPAGKRAEAEKAEAEKAPAAIAKTDEAPAERPATVDQRDVDKAARPTCPGCGTGNDADAAFCKKCGRALAAAPAAAADAPQSEGGAP